MKYDFIVLGADGQQGRIVTRDLLERGFSIFASDLYESGVKKIINKYKKRPAVFKFLDLRDIKATTKMIIKSGSDIVINCADMYQNINVYKACLTAGVNCVDLGSWIELTDQQLKMNAKFKKIGKIAITGCGSVPGIGNIMLSYAAKKMDSVESVDVGFAWDSNMKKFVVPFSLKSILEELTYDPRIIKDGNWVNVPPMTISKERNFRSIGRQKTYCVQHPEIFTFLHYFRSRGLKNIRFFAGFPGHSLSTIQGLIDVGFHSDKKLRVESIKVAPFDLVAVVSKQLTVPEGYTEKENLFVEIDGRKNGKKASILMECIVPPIAGWEKSGSNVDTGFPASIIAQMIKDGRISAPGSYAPEAIVPETEFMKELWHCGFSVFENGVIINKEKNLPAASSLIVSVQL